MCDTHAKVAVKEYCCVLTFSSEMNLWSTVSLVDHLQPARTLPTHALCALYLHTRTPRKELMSIFRDPPDGLRISDGDRLRVKDIMEQGPDLNVPAVDYLEGVAYFLDLSKIEYSFGKN